MAQETTKFDQNNAISLGNTSDLKEEFQNVYYPDNKVGISETTITDIINIKNSQLNEYIGNDRIRKYEKLSVGHIKTDLSSSEVSDAASNNVKLENGINFVDVKNEFCSELLLCNHCHEVYQDYCTKCRVLVHILNKRTYHHTYNRIKELPIYMLETRESCGYLGIFALKVIPENVRFGPFTGLNSTGLPLRIRGGKFVISNDQSELMNWMHYINPARNIYEQNLFPFQYEDKLYYWSTRRIQEGEELLVYFGENYENNLLENREMGFVPITKEDVENVFACTFCCMGFRSKEYLAEHKTMFHSEINEMFSVEELAQCSFCKIYLEAKEYFEHHMDYCRETNASHCVLPLQGVSKRDVGTRPSLRSKTKRRKRVIYTCTQCKFRTMYNADFRQHTNEHYKVKMYKCGICHRRYKTKESLKAHLEENHIDNDGRDVHVKSKHLKVSYYTCMQCEYQTNSKSHLERHRKSKHLKLRDYKCMECGYETNFKSNLEQHVMSKHRKEYDYKCKDCEYQTNFKPCLNKHIKSKHLKLWDYKCVDCEYQTNFKSIFELHVKTKHLKVRDYKCMECEYQTNIKSSLKKHIKSKHLKLWDYKCVECEYQTNFKPNFDLHVKTKHLKVRDYKCMECEYQTNIKSCLKKHIKSTHLKLLDYKCMECEYRTYVKSNLERHVKLKHLKVRDYKCMNCEYETNSKSSFERHVKSKHLKVRDYKCVECEYETTDKANLRRHVKSKHVKLHDYKCMECEYLTYVKSNFERHVKFKHLKVHDYKCIQCEYQTNAKSSFERHVKSKHLKLWDYKCMECEYQTNFKSSLQEHVKTKHLNLSDYKCMECQYQTNLKRNLKRHYKGKHLKAVVS